jgi:hypothetical protein
MEKLRIWYLSNVRNPPCLNVMLSVGVLSIDVFVFLHGSPVLFTVLNVTGECIVLNLNLEELKMPSSDLYLLHSLGCRF